MKHTDKSLTAYLENMLKNYPEPLEYAVASLLLAENQPLICLKGVCTYGCSNGWIDGLITHYDTYKFFDTYYVDILDLYCEYNMMVPPQINIKNDLAWWSFEVIAGRIADDLGIYE